jgi:putative acetyltransferase
MIIRRAGVEDADSIKKLHKETIRKVNSKDYNKEQIKIWVRRNTKKHFSDSIEKRNIFFVALEKNKLLGYASLSLSKHKVQGLYVKHDFNGKGIGSKLLNKIEDYAKKYGLKLLELESTITAFNFYKHKGYKKIKVINASFDDVKIPCILMKKVLK